MEILAMYDKLYNCNKIDMPVTLNIYKGIMSKLIDYHQM